jgi:DNA-binding MurR/RpiR family transcriptional regulator
VLALAGARRVVVLGFRNSAWLALYARIQLGLLRPAVDLAPLPSQTLSESLVGLGRGDVILAVGMRRRVPSFAAAIQAARDEGVRIVLLTDPTGQPMCRVPTGHLAVTAAARRCSTPTWPPSA